ncbi:MAG: hypothetical protein KBC42_02620 [Candidatus Pacebacteria bacterium]|nr:hypothetical protein [Candidatus Paceibacterota bacterium]MBP9780794.1 hypothetical protein [Candidatus Paceibacterota bacterium]
MEQNPFAQSSSQSVPPTHDKKKVYISILIIAILMFGIFYIVRQFGEQRNRRIKEDMIQRLGEQQDVSVSTKVEMINRINEGNSSLPTEQETVEARTTKEELIKRLK